MFEEINQSHRRFLGTVAMTIAAASLLGMIGAVVQQVTPEASQLPIEGEFPSLGGATGWLNSQPLF